MKSKLQMLVKYGTFTKIHDVTRATLPLRGRLQNTETKCNTVRHMLRSKCEYFCLRKHLPFNNMLLRIKKTPN